MLRYLIRRLLWACVLFVAVTIVTYVIFYAIPANPARLACGQRATPECIKRAAHYLGTDRPLYVQYGKFFGRLMPVAGIVQGSPHFKTPSLGRSFTNRQTVNYVVLNAAPVTASLVFGGAVFWMLIALPVGILSALRPRSLLDRIAMVFVLIGISAHPVWIGLIFAYFFGFKAGLFPITGYCDFFNPSGGLRRAGPVGLPPDPALGDVRDPLRRALRADDPRERDGGARTRTTCAPRAPRARRSGSSCARTSCATRCCRS